MQAGDLARRLPEAVDAKAVRSALELLKELPALMLPKEQLAATAQQLLRVVMSYQAWLLPRAFREDLPGGPALWSLGVPVPGAPPGGAQLLPLAVDEAAYESLTKAGVAAREGAVKPVMMKTVLSGCEAVAEHVPGESGRMEGLVLNPGQEDELVLSKDQLPQLQSWEATLRLETLLAELDEDAHEQERPASGELATLLAERAKLFFVRTPDGKDLARDNLARNFLLLTSLDAAALCAQAYGSEQVRAVSAEELLDMGRQSGGEWGFTLTLGPDRSPQMADASAKHIPKWSTRKVSAEWLVTALEEGRQQ